MKEICSENPISTQNGTLYKRKSLLVVNANLDAIMVPRILS